MSEWKWCLDCHHAITQHRRDDGTYDNPCLVEGCDCPAAYIDAANF